MGGKKPIRLTGTHIHTASDAFSYRTRNEDQKAHHQPYGATFMKAVASWLGKTLASKGMGYAYAS